MLFEEIDLLEDPEPLAPALNMALDEALLLHGARAGRPLLRVYRWACPAVSFGYFEPWAEVAAAFSGRTAVRRWTGGGVVPHGEDFTYSVIVPRGHPFAHVPASESYRALHHALARAIASGEKGRERGGVTLTPEAAEKRSRACFENPARHDLLYEGRKIAGGAQRRSRLGLLHQGSIQEIALPERFGERLAAALVGDIGYVGQRTRKRAVTAEEWSAARELEASKYGTESWNRRF